MPALLMAGEDRQHNALPEARQLLVIQATRELVAELVRRDPACSLPAPTSDTPAAEGTAATGIWLIPARDGGDEIAALALNHLLLRRRIDSLVTPVASTRPESLAALRHAGALATVVSALPPSALSGVRSLVRRLRHHAPDRSHFAGVWQRNSTREELMTRLRGDEPADLFTTLEAAVERLERVNRAVDPTPESAASGLPGPIVLSTAPSEKIAAK
ncbi:MAG: hypothetical protein JNL92_01305 [Opitutaceae bacterium]|nr:hypothetical protein [Opitutaceae bacterium]